MSPSRRVMEALNDSLCHIAVARWQAEDKRPFFLYLAYNAVHSPLQGDDKYMERFSHIGDIQRRIFAAMLAQLDDGVGQVLDAVKKEGILENTMIVFFRDNGGPTCQLSSSNLPPRGGKGNL